jgi:hypothetical protein
MSAKWRRVQAWDREHLTGVLTPVRLVLHALSSIALAVVLLSGVALYAVLASVPIGLLALGLSWAVYGAVLAAAVILPAACLAFVVRRVVVGRGARFVATFAGIVAGAAGGVALWTGWLWPALRYDAVTGGGLRLFPGLVEAYSGTTLRRLPAFEMTELEFYGWWPMRLLLAVFVLNMIVATVRRIEFRFVNLGVLTVHTGIVLIAGGSLYYNAFKQEGDTILLAGESAVGPAQPVFNDRDAPALWINAGPGWAQRPLDGVVPRYNDYGLAEGAAGSVRSALGFGAPIDTAADAGRTLDRPVLTEGVDPSFLPGDVSFSVVGFAAYADPVTDWVEVAPPRAEPRPLRMAYLVGPPRDDPSSAERLRQLAFALRPGEPRSQVSEFPEIAVEYAIGMPEGRWSALRDTARVDAGHVLVARVGGATQIVPVVRTGERIDLAQTGWSLAVEQVLSQPPFPILTDGYRDAGSSLAIVRVWRPDGLSFARWVYHRFPELNQDLTDAAAPSGQPVRSDPDPSIDVVYLDQSKIQIYLNEDPASGLVEAVVRWAGERRVEGGLAEGSVLSDFLAPLSIELGARWADSREVQRPAPVPPVDQDGDFVGRHDRAMLAVRASSPALGWSETVWLPFCRYADVTSMRSAAQRTLSLPDGRLVSLVFGRVQRPLPGFRLRLVDFEMLSYDHRGAPRDYQSIVRVEPAGEAPALDESYDHTTRLNSPLKAPFIWSAQRSALSNVAGEILSHLSPRQFKFSQAGWDRAGWEQTQQLADRGLAERPRASFTILGVGNNPGIHVIALGGVLMGLGIPWAFYVKPWLVRRKKRAIQRTLRVDAPAAPAEPVPIGAPL